MKSTAYRSTRGRSACRILPGRDVCKSWPAADLWSATVAGYCRISRMRQSEISIKIKHLSALTRGSGCLILPEEFTSCGVFRCRPAVWTVPDEGMRTHGDSVNRLLRNVPRRDGVHQT